MTKHREARTKKGGRLSTNKNFSEVLKYMNAGMALGQQKWTDQYAEEFCSLISLVFADFSINNCCTGISTSQEVFATHNPA